MTAFTDALEFVLRHEGGYSNRSNDRGGETYRGISRKAHPNWIGWDRVDALTDKNEYSLQLDLAVRSFYRSEFWDKIGGDSIAQIAPKLALVAFDYAVHSGPPRAVETLQRIVGAHPDGAFGPKTLASVREWMDRALASLLLQRRGMFVRELDDYAYNPGWENRLADLAQEIA